MTKRHGIDLSADYYAVLGVLPAAEDVVIKGAYRALAQRYHPDRFAGSRDEANARMAELNEAYRVLSDASLRSRYDETRVNGQALDAARANMAFEAEQFRSFAEKLASWEYDRQAIYAALIQRGVRHPIAQLLADSVSGKSAG